MLGAVIGTSDRVLLDGTTTFRVPSTGWTTPEGRLMENWGVPPDILVENRAVLDHLVEEDGGDGALLHLAGLRAPLRASRREWAELRLQLPAGSGERAPSSGSAS